MSLIQQALVTVLIWGLVVPPSFAEHLPTATEINALQKKLLAEQEAPPPEKDITDSYLSDFLTKVWKEPKYQSVAGSIVIGETLIAAALITRARLNKKNWIRQLEVAREVSVNLKDVSAKLVAAEGEVLKALTSMSQADRAELLKALTADKKTILPHIETALKSEGAVTGAVGLEEATINLERAYEQWQKQAMAETRVLKAAGATVEHPATLAEVSLEVQQQVKAVTRLEFAQAQFTGYAEAGFKHLADTAKFGLTKGLTWKGRLWRRARMPLLLIAIPIVVVGISFYFDRETEKERRIQDRNTSANFYRDIASKSLIPYMGRPVLFAFVKGWENSQGKDGSALKRFKSPLEIMEIEEENESLPVIEALAMQTLLDMREAGEDVIEENGKKFPLITENFFKRLTMHVLQFKKSLLLNLKPAELKQVVADIAFHSYRAFDK